jgi:hypothetical protein
VPLITARGKQAVQRIEERLKPRLSPGEDIDKIWDAAANSSQVSVVDRAVCQLKYNSLMQAYNQLVPENKRIEKDF